MTGVDFREPLNFTGTVNFSYTATKNANGYFAGKLSNFINGSLRYDSADEHMVSCDSLTTNGNDKYFITAGSNNCSHNA